jgi:hypothetical protein
MGMGDEWTADMRGLSECQDAAELLRDSTMVTPSLDTEIAVQPVVWMEQCVAKMPQRPKRTFRLT